MSSPLDIPIIGFNLHLHWVSKQNNARTGFGREFSDPSKRSDSQPDEPEMECSWTRDTEEAL